MKIGYFLAYFGAILSTAFLSAACETTSNTNVRVVNANANTAVVVNATPAARDDRDDDDRWNANMSREEYDRNRADYEKDRGDSKIGTGANDSWLWFKTRAALMTTDDLRESTINVDVENGVITLRGTVGSAAQKASAEKVANGIEGKTSVRNQLQVRAGDSMTNQMVNGSSSNSNRR
jgi:hypothetical protein